jgi:putative colanic acid biosynthesis UDP-glucose lipid carrier transferase
MVYNRVQGLKNAYYWSLAFVLVASFWSYLGLLVLIFHADNGYNYGQYLLYQLAALCGLGLSSINSHRLNDRVLRCDVLGSHSIALRNVLFVAGAILLLLVLFKDPQISRLFLFSYLPLLYVVFFYAHRHLPRFVMRTFFSNRYQRKALLVGPTEKAREMKDWCKQTVELGLDISYLVENSAEQDGFVHLTEIENLRLLERTIARGRIQQLILLELPSQQQVLGEIARLCNRLGTRLLVVNNLSELFHHPVSFFNLYGFDFISFREEPLEDPVNRLLKRALDIAISVPVVLFILPPVMLLVAILHRLQCPGPLFYRQTRAGFSRNPFRILKFRTMHPKARSRKQATANDARVFAAGRWLRRTSLDELPQFINVLRGEMSIVGPRPHMLIHDRKFCRALESYLVRSYVKPGITGLAQIRGYRGEVTNERQISERVKYDTNYLEFWSIWRDLQILLVTIKQIFYPPTSAY